MRIVCMSTTSRRHGTTLPSAFTTNAATSTVGPGARARRGSSADTTTTRCRCARERLRHVQQAARGLARIDVHGEIQRERGRREQREQQGDNDQHESAARHDGLRVALESRVADRTR
jgi:hypothetical protein